MPIVGMNEWLKTSSENRVNIQLFIFKKTINLSFCLPRSLEYEYHYLSN